MTMSTVERRVRPSSMAPCLVHSVRTAILNPMRPDIKSQPAALTHGPVPLQVSERGKMGFKLLWSSEV